MNTNIILDTFNTFLKQLIASVVAEAIKPLEERIAVLEAGEWTAMEHVAAKEIQPLQDRVIALEINQSLGRAQADKVNIADLVAELVDGHDFSNKIEEGIENYDFSDIMRENLPDMVDEDRVQEMIDESLDNLTITRN